MGKSKMTELNNIWKDHSIPLQLKIKLLKCLICSVAMYGYQAWNLIKADESRLETAEMCCFLRRLSNISWDKWKCYWRAWSTKNFWANPWWQVEEKNPETLKGCPQYSLSCLSVCVSVFLSVCKRATSINVPRILSLLTQGLNILRGPSIDHIFQIKWLA